MYESAFWAEQPSAHLVIHQSSQQNHIETCNGYHGPRISTQVGYGSFISDSKQLPKMNVHALQTNHCHREMTPFRSGITLYT